MVMNENLISLNKIKRTVIGLAQASGETAVVRTRPLVAPVATKGSEKIFRPVKTSWKKSETPGFREGEPDKFYLSLYAPDDPGKRQVFEVPEYIQREIEYISEIDNVDNLLFQTASFANSLVRGTLVTYDPVFIAGNAVNDMVTAYARAGVMPWQSGEQLLSIMKHWFQDDNFIQAYTMAGGRQQRFYGAGIESLSKQALARGEESVSGIQKAGSLIKGTADLIPKMGEAVEMAPRLAAARKHLDGLSNMKNMDGSDMHPNIVNWKQRLKEGTLSPYELSQMPEMKRAMEQGVEATINFARGGRKIQRLNKYILFLNAGMEGTKLPFRAIARDPRRAANRLGLMMASGLGITAYNTSDQFTKDEYGNDLIDGSSYYDIPLHIRLGSIIIMLPGEKRNEQGDIIPNYVRVVPKIREWSMFLAPITWLVEKISSESAPSAWDAFMTLLPEVLPVNMYKVGGTEIPGPPIPELLAMGIEMASNYDLYRNRAIVPDYLQGQPPSKQVTPWTSKSIVALSGKLEGMLDPDSDFDSLVSPQRLDHLAKSFGVVGREAPNISDFVYELLRDDPDPEIKKLAKEWEEMGYRERQEFEISMKESDPSKLETIMEEAQGTGALPFVTSLQRKFSPRHRPELQTQARDQADEFAREVGIDPDQTRNFSGRVKQLKDEAQKKKVELGKKYQASLRNNSMDAKDISSRIEFRKEIGKIDRQVSAAIEGYETDGRYSKAVHFASPEIRNKYYNMIYSLGSQQVDRRDPAEKLASKFRSISPVEIDGEEDLDKFFEDRRVFREGLSPEDEAAMDAILQSSMTEDEKRLENDMNRMRGFWNIERAHMENAGLLKEWKEYKNTEGSKARREFLDKHIMLDRELDNIPFKKDMARENDSELDRMLVYWGYYGEPIYEKKRKRGEITPIRSGRKSFWK